MMIGWSFKKEFEFQDGHHCWTKFNLHVEVDPVERKTSHKLLT